MQWRWLISRIAIVVVIGFWVVRTSVCAAATPQRPEFPIEMRVVDVSAVQLQMVRVSPGDANTLPTFADERFAVVVSSLLGRSLAATPGARILATPHMTASAGSPSRVQLASRSAESLLQLDLDVNVTPTDVTDVNVTLDVSVQIRLHSGDSPRPLFSSPPFAPRIRLTAGQSAIVGGILLQSEIDGLFKPEVQNDPPLIQSLLSQKSGNGDARQVLIVLTPVLPVAATKAKAIEISDVTQGTIPSSTEFMEKPQDPPAASPPVSQPVPSGPAYTVQIAAFTTRSAAETLRGKLDKLYGNAYIEVLAADRVLYRVRVGRFERIQEARRLASKLRADGFTAIAVSLR